MHLRTVAALLLTAGLVSAPIGSPGAVASHSPAAATRAAYPEPQAGQWDYDRYISEFEIGRFRVRPGTGTKPPKVLAIRFGVEAAEGSCPKVETRVTVITKPIALKKAPDIAEGRTRYQWVMAKNTTYDEDFADHNYGLEPVPVQVSVAGAAAVPGTLSMLLQQSFEGGKYRWVVNHTVLSYKSCRLYALSGRPTSDR